MDDFLVFYIYTEYLQSIKEFTKLNTPLRSHD